MATRCWEPLLLYAMQESEERDIYSLDGSGMVLMMSSFLSRGNDVVLCINEKFQYCYMSNIIICYVST